VRTRRPVVVILSLASRLLFFPLFFSFVFLHALPSAVRPPVLPNRLYLVDGYSLARLVVCYRRQAYMHNACRWFCRGW